MTTTATIIAPKGIVTIAIRNDYGPKLSSQIINLIQDAFVEESCATISTRCRRTER